MSQVGRNDACPCGSGKKFKRCCGAKPARDGVLVFGDSSNDIARINDTWRRARQALSDHAEAWLGKPGEVEANECSPFAAVLPEQQQFWVQMWLTWQFYDFIPAGENQSIAQHWLATTQPGRDVEVANLVRTASEQALSIFQAQSVDKGRGLVVRDLITGAERMVHDRSISLTVEPGFILLARLLPLGERFIFDAVSPRSVPPQFLSGFSNGIGELGLAPPATPAAVRSAAKDLADLFVSAVGAIDAHFAAKEGATKTLPSRPAE